MSKKFSEQMSMYIESYIRRLDLLVQNVTGSLFQYIVIRTPVDTGRTRGNYFLSVDGTVVSDYDENFFDPTGELSISRAQSQLKNIKAGGVVRIINHTPYIMELEFNSASKQAPYGMARITVAEFQPIVDAEVKKLVGNAR